MSAAKMVCPKCGRYWGDMKYRFKEKGDLIPPKPTDFKIVSGNRRKLKNGEVLLCSLCGYEYKNTDVYISIAAAMGGQNKELKPGEQAKI